METYRYWRSSPVGERLVAVCDLSEAAYAFAGDFRGESAHDDQGLQGSASRVQRKRG